MSDNVCACGHLRGNHGRYGDHRAVTGCEGPPCDGTHDPRCFQVRGVPADLPADLCDCRIWRMFDTAALCDGCDRVAPGVLGSPDGRSQLCRFCMAEVSQ